MQWKEATAELDQIYEQLNQKEEQIEELKEVLARLPKGSIPESDTAARSALASAMVAVGAASSIRQAVAAASSDAPVTTIAAAIEAKLADALRQHVTAAVAAAASAAAVSTPAAKRSPGPVAVLAPTPAPASSPGLELSLAALTQLITASMQKQQELNSTLNAISMGLAPMVISTPVPPAATSAAALALASAGAASRRPAGRTGLLGIHTTPSLQPVASAASAGSSSSSSSSSSLSDDDHDDSVEERRARWWKARQITLALTAAAAAAAAVSAAASAANPSPAAVAASDAAPAPAAATDVEGKAGDAIARALGFSHESSADASAAAPAAEPAASVPAAAAGSVGAAGDIVTEEKEHHDQSAGSPSKKRRLDEGAVDASCGPGEAPGPNVCADDGNADDFDGTTADELDERDHVAARRAAFGLPRIEDDAGEEDDEDFEDEFHDELWEDEMEEEEEERQRRARREFEHDDDDEGDQEALNKPRIHYNRVQRGVELAGADLQAQLAGKSILSSGGAGQQQSSATAAASSSSSSGAARASSSFGMVEGSMTAVVDPSLLVRALVLMTEERAQLLARAHELSIQGGLPALHADGRSIAPDRTNVCSSSSQSPSFDPAEPLYTCHSQHPLKTPQLTKRRTSSNPSKTRCRRRRRASLSCRCVARGLTSAVAGASEAFRSCGVHVCSLAVEMLATIEVDPILC